jgi:hypothetical protein
LLPFKKSGYVAAAAGPSSKRPRIEQTSSETGKFLPCQYGFTYVLIYHSSSKKVVTYKNNRKTARFFLPFGKILGRKNITQGKYSAVSTAAMPHLASLPASVGACLVAAAFSASTWKRMSAAVSFQKIRRGLGYHFNLAFFLRKRK